MIALIDYDAGNMKSVEKAFKYIGADVVPTSDRNVLDRAEKIIFPGVGSFGAAMQELEARGLVQVIKENVAKGKPFLGICLGMQMLFDYSEETPDVSGLGILPGKCVKIKDAPGLKVPQIGWNSIKYTQPECALFRNIPEDTYFYFVHSYHICCDNEKDAAAVTEYGETLQIAVCRDNVYGVQFHPEKSGDAGLRLLKNFVEM